MAENPSLQDDKPEGKDLQLFRVRMRVSFKQLVANMSLEKFEEIFAEVLDGKKSRAKRLHKIWQDTVVNGLESEFNDIIIEENLDEVLRNRSRVIEENQNNSNSVAWRPPEDPVEHVRSHDMEEIMKRKNELEEYVKKKEAEVKQLERSMHDGVLLASKLQNDLTQQRNKLKTDYEKEKIFQNLLQNSYKKLF